ncbi:MAG TPA: hypothetical protein VJT49_23005 [Amycolatopsis sp.]|uniref:hypothetical protein n=1 Tax=Amycolatopsis sp. TaxID=37632 RepID=UPI002B4640CA|nr:hypothetical protein [Amycolatopsis sp.]HKS47926.1 hypothetical protein [Amycolatopsis sp.]
MNVALGSESTVDEARAEILVYYGFSGAHAEQTADAHHTPVRPRRDHRVRRSGAEEIMLCCWSADPGPIDRLAEPA